MLHARARWTLAVAAWLVFAASVRAAAPTASDPRFDDRALWPKLTGKEAFVAEPLKPARVLVWGGMGEKGNKTGGAGWVDLATGKGGGRPDAHTDIILPASDQPYTVGGRGGKYRNVTVMRNAHLSGGGDGVGMVVTGSIWIHAGGSMRTQGACRIEGPGHVFIRNDNTEDIWQSPLDNRIRIGQYVNFAKTDGGSAEIIGHVSVNDEFSIIDCTVVVGPDASLQPGRNGHPKITAGGVLAVMDGGYWGVWTNNFETTDLIVEGTIQGGLPERPLTREAYLGIASKNFTGAIHRGPGGPGKNHQVRVVGLMLQPGSRVRSYTTDPDKALLTVTLSRDNYGWAIRPKPGSAFEAKTLRKDPDAKALFAWYDGLPPFIDVAIADGVSIDGVRFDHVRKGGLLMTDPRDAEGWKNVSFGPHSQGPRDALIAEHEGVGRNGEY